MATDHAKCAPDDHDRSVDGIPKDIQARAADGLMGCNDCGEPLFYCRKSGWYFHVDPEVGCFMSPAWG